MFLKPEEPLRIPALRTPSGKHGGKPAVLQEFRNVCLWWEQKGALSIITL
jgi:hypothetical protein